MAEKPKTLEEIDREEDSEEIILLGLDDESRKRLGLSPLTPDQRKKTIEEYKAQHHWEGTPEGLACERLERERADLLVQIETVKASPESTAIEIEAKERVLKGLEERLGKPHAPAVVDADRCAVFRDMKSLAANEVSISFVGDKPEADRGMAANNVLKISARGKETRVTLSELGLIDHRRDGEPNKLCGILLSMAVMRRFPRSDSNAKLISRLRGTLERHFGIKDWFYMCSKPPGWEPYFTINDNRGAADRRAEHDAAFRSISRDQTPEDRQRFGPPRPYFVDPDAHPAADEWLQGKTIGNCADDAEIDEEEQ